MTKESPDPVGALGVSIANLGAVPDVATIRLSAAGPDAFVHEMTPNARQEWTYLRKGLALGDYTLQAEALDASGVVIYESVQAPVTIAADATVQVILVLHPNEAADGITNHAPEFRSIAASDSIVRPNETVSLVFQVADMDGDAMDLIGSTTCFAFPCASAGNLAPGSISFGASNPGDVQTATTVWTAPAEPGTYSLRFVLTDVRGAASDVSLQLQVGEGTGDLEVEFVINMAPLVTAITATPQSGSPVVDLAATASDDYDASTDLIFLWEADPATCTGTFSAQAAATAFTLGGFVGGSATCMITLTVSDLDGNQNVSAIYLNDTLIDLRSKPVLRAVFQTQTDAVAGDVIEFGVEADLYGMDLGVDPIFAWGLPGTLSSTAETTAGVASELSWTAVAGELVCVGGNATFTVVATGGESGLPSDPVEFVVAVDPSLCLP